MTREWKLTADDFDRLNVNGCGISLDHPVGATGGRILATMTREMQRRQVRYGLETMCIGGGQGLAAVLNALANDDYIALLTLAPELASQLRQL